MGMQEVEEHKVVVVEGEVEVEVEADEEVGMRLWLGIGAEVGAEAEDNFHLHKRVGSHAQEEALLCSDEMAGALDVDCELAELALVGAGHVWGGARGVGQDGVGQGGVG